MDGPTKPDERLKAFTCPLDGEPCQAGAPADCRHFWRCVREAMRRRQGASADECAGDAPPPSRRASRPPTGRADGA